LDADAVFNVVDVAGKKIMFAHPPGKPQTIDEWAPGI
jgi:hypothetical protein